MASQTDIANLALLTLGARPITDLEDPDDDSAVAISTAWGLRRDACLREHAWRFALKRETLPALTSVPDYDYTVQFQLPLDCLKVLQIGLVYVGVDLSNMRIADSALYRVEGQYILARDSTALPLRYVARISETGHWDASFNSFFAADLAATCAERITNSSTKVQTAMARRQMALRMALRANAIEAPPDPLADSEWMLSRFLY